MSDTDNTDIDPEGVADEIRAKRQWMIWDSSAETDRRPYGWDDESGALDPSGSWTEPTDWLTFEEALEASRTKETYGIGYVFRENDEYVPLDVDGCYDENGDLKDWVPALDRFKGETYIEYSPSGDGLHILVEHPGIPPWWENQHFTDDEHEGQEAYDKKFFTVTGDRHPESTETIEEVNPDGYLWNAFKNITGETPDLDNNQPDSNSNSNHTTRDNVDVSVYDLVSKNQYPEGERCSHPCHSSGTGSNFHVDGGGETFRCWRHGTTGNGLHLLGMQENIINCGDWDGSDLTDSEWEQIFEKAREKGLDVPEKERQPTNEVSTLANGGKTPESAEKDESTGASENENARWYDRAEQFTNYVEQLPSDEKPRVAKVRAQIAEYINEEYTLLCPKTDEGVDVTELLAYTPEHGRYERSGIHDIRRDASLGVQWLSSGDLEEVLKLLAQYNAVDRETLDAGEFDHDYVNLKNCVYDIEEGKRLDHSPKYRFRHMVPRNYDPEATCPKIENLIKSIIPREIDRKTIYEWFGFCLEPGYQLHRFLILYGDGGNGKGELFRLQNELLGGENVAHVGLEKFTGDNSFDLAELDGKLAHNSGDVSGGYISTEETGVLKELSGGDKRQVQRKYGHPFNLDNRAPLAFAANERPRFPTKKDGIPRRLLSIECPNKFTTDPDDGHKDALSDRELREIRTDSDELDGLLRYAIEGLQRLREKGKFSLEELGTDQERFDAYMREADAIVGFADTCLTNREGTALPASVAYNAFTRYCEDTGAIPTDNKAFARELRRKTEVEIHDKQPRLELPSGTDRPRIYDHLWIQDSALQYLSGGARSDILAVVEHMHPLQKDYAQDLLMNPDDGEVSEETETSEESDDIEETTVTGGRATATDDGDGTDTDLTPKQAVSGVVLTEGEVERWELLATLGHRYDIAPDTAKTALQTAISEGRVIEHDQGTIEPA